MRDLATERIEGLATCRGGGHRESRLHEIDTHEFQQVGLVVDYENAFFHRWADHISAARTREILRRATG
jgi:hypothetical protein